MNPRVCDAGRESGQVQICGKNVGLHPCGEVQLTLHLPTRRQTGTQLAAVAADSGVNPNLAAWRGPGPLIHQEKEAGERAEEADRAGRRADRRGEVRVVGFSFGGEGRCLFDPRPPSPVLPDFLSSPSANPGFSPVCVWQRPLCTRSIAIASSPQQ